MLKNSSIGLPNILLIVIDCARSDVWLNRCRASLTPNLDRLRQDGLTMPETIVECSSTTPSFTTLLSGLYSPRHGVRLILGHVLGEDVHLLTRDLVTLGYHTYAEVTGPLIADIGLRRAFEEYRYRAPIDYLHTAWGDLVTDRLEKGGYKKPWFVLLHLWELHKPRHIGPAYRVETDVRDDYESAVVSLDSQLGRVFEAAGEDVFLIVTGDHGEKTSREAYRPGTAVDYIRDYLGIDRVCGASLHHLASLAGPSVVHHLFIEWINPAMEEAGRQKRLLAPSFGLMRRIADIGRMLCFLPRITPGDLRVFHAPLKLTEWMHKRGLLDKERSQEKIKRFLRKASRAALDEMFSRLLLSSYRNDYVEGHNIHVYDYLVKVPLVMRWKGRLPGGQTIPRMIRQPDVLPTVLDLLGSPVGGHKQIDGRSFKPLLDGSSWDSLPAFLSTGAYLRQVEINGLRTEDWKFSYGPYNPDLPEELYNLREDPGESTNLAADLPGQCARMRGLLKTLSFPVDSVSSQTPDKDRKCVKDLERSLKDLGYLD